MKNTPLLSTVIRRAAPVLAVLALAATTLAAATPRVVLSDPLNAATKGQAFGGKFLPEGGWTVAGDNDRVIWILPPMGPDGMMEFDVRNFDPPHQVTTASNIFASMWGQLFENYEDKDLANTDNWEIRMGKPWKTFKLEYHSRGIGKVQTWEPFPEGFDPKRTYHFKIVWQDGKVTSSIDDRVLVYSDGFAPATTEPVDRFNFLALGTSPHFGGFATLGPVYSNVKVTELTPKPVVAKADPAAAKPAPAAPAKTTAAPVKVRFPGGRIALTSDGNLHDKDDIGATALSLALIDAAGLKSRFVHYDFGNHLGGNSAGQEAAMIESAVGGAQRFDLDPARVFNDQSQLAAAIENFRQEGNKSSEQDPLWYVCAGPMESAWRCVNAVEPEKRKFIHCISHSGWNDKHGDTPEMTHQWEDLGKLGATLHHISDQNSSNGEDDFNSSAEKWVWLKNASNPNWKWLYARNVKSTFDVSDTGMVFWLITGGPDGGNEKGGSAEAQYLMEHPVR